MLVVIALGADGAQRCFQLVGRQHPAHSSISMPSQAISQPAASASTRCGEVGQQHRVGVVDVDEDAAADGEPGASAAIEPSAPAMLICPMRRPVLAPTPVRGISSSVHVVPSKSSSVGPVEAGRQIGRHSRAAGQVPEAAAAAAVGDAQADAVLSH